MAGKSSRSDNFAPGPPATRYNASGKNREFYTFENAPGLGNYATGGTIIDGGDGYIYHIFTGTGTFTVNRPPAAIDSVDYLIVAGGGGASATFADPGGGGGGGMLFGNALIGPGPYPISVGAGGPSSPNVTSSTRNGTPSSAFTVTASGGGGGGEPATPVPQRAGSPGGSGGGGGATPGTSPVPTSSGSAIDTVPRQGYPAGAPQPSTGVNRGGTGGGGAGGSGAQGTGPPSLGGAGGPGRIAPEFPSTIVRQAIPAPVRPTWEPLVGPGGYSRGGNGFPFPTSQNSPDNSGYGGSDLAGGSGIVCVRYKKTAPYSRATGGIIEPSTHPEHPGVFRHIFTSPGNFTVTDPTLQYIDYLAVGGGGGGGAGSGVCGGGGGGGGGFVSSIHTSTTTPLVILEAYPWNPGYSVRVGEQYPVGVGTYPIGIGTGGRGIHPGGVGPGSNTTIGSQIIAAGGGGGGSSTGPIPTGIGGNGGSGGGGNKGLVPGSTFGGTATPTPLIQGNPGGGGSPPSEGFGAGGGGAGAAALSSGINGAEGWYSVLSPSAYGTPGPLTPTAIYRYFAGGGGGKGPPSSAFGTGGVGGGAPGRAGAPPPVPGINGTTNTGGGGGNGNDANGGVGGPGIVIIQYPE